MCKLKVKVDNHTLAMLRHISKVLVATSAPFIAAKCLSTPPPPKHDLPKARVAIIGAGVGGCSAAYFLRELGGKNLEIHVFSADGRVGGRADVVDIDGHLYESGGSVIHTSNKYLVDMTEAFGTQAYSREERGPFLRE